MRALRKAETIHIAVLRAINVAGHATVAMADLRALITKLGLRDARSILQSGNLVFGSDGRSGGELEQLLEAETGKRLGLHADIMVRSSDEWADLIARNPFPGEAKSDPSHLLVMILKTAPAKAAVIALQSAIAGSEIVRSVGRQLYVTYPDGIGRSRVTNMFIEKRLGTSGTGRNWNTVLKIAAAIKET